VTVVRELITRLGFVVDQESFRKAEKQIEDLHKSLTSGSSSGAAKPSASSGGWLVDNGKKATKAIEETQAATSKLTETFAMLGRQLAALGIGAKLNEFVQLASDANETTSAIGQLFGTEGAKQVDDWSHAMGEAMGRSAYDLQAYAARLGSVLGPITKTQEQARLMSESLSGLAVDLASFFNTSDQDAMQALRSGLTGEYESLKRYGVVLNDATLTEVAHAQGLKKKVSQMTVAEKTELRYAAVMKLTKQAQGDAARTGEGFANASKALNAQIKTLGIDMARKVIPAFEKLVRAGRELIKWFNETRKGTKILEAAFVTLGAVVVWLGRETLMAFALPLAMIGAMVLLVDELWNLFTGGKTIIGDWLDKTYGIGTTNKLIEGTIEFFKKLNTTIERSIAYVSELVEQFGDLEGAFELIENKFTGANKDRGADLAAGVDKVEDWLMKPLRDAQNKYIRAMHAKGLLLDVPEMEAQAYKYAKGRGTGADVYGSESSEREQFDRDRRRAREESRRRGIRERRQAREDADELYQQAEYAAALEAGVPMTPGTAYAAKRRRKARENRAALAGPAWSISPEVEAERIRALTDAPGGMSTLPTPIDEVNQGESISGYAAAQLEAAVGAAVASTMPDNMSVNVSMPAPVINISGDPVTVRKTVQQVLSEERKAAAAAIPRRGGT
jgi:hypothetical protein